MKNYNLLKFDDVDSYLNYVERAPIHGDSHQLGSNRDTRGWSGTETFEEAMNLARNGWPEGARQMKYSLDEILKNFQSPADILQYNVSGLLLDAGRAATGLPDSFLENQTIFEVKKTLDIVIHIGVLADVDPQQIINRGAAILGLLDNLSARDYDLKVWAISYATYLDSAPNPSPLIALELPTRPLNIDLLNFILIQPAMHRRLNFAAREVFNQNTEGGSYRTRNIDSETVKEVFGNESFYIPALEYHQTEFNDFHTSKLWIERHLETIMTKTI